MLFLVVYRFKPEPLIVAAQELALLSMSATSVYLLRRLYDSIAALLVDRKILKLSVFQNIGLLAILAAYFLRTTAGVPLFLELLHWQLNLDGLI